MSQTWRRIGYLILEDAIRRAEDGFGVLGWVAPEAEDWGMAVSDATNLGSRFNFYSGPMVEKNGGSPPRQPKWASNPLSSVSAMNNYGLAEG